MAGGKGWTIGTAAGTGVQGRAGDGEPATAALLNNPFDLAFGPGGHLIFSDTFNHRICKIDRRTATIATIAGTGERGFDGDGGPAVAAKLNEPYGVVVDKAGTVYCADRLNRRVRAISRAPSSRKVRRLKVPVSGSVTARRLAASSARSMCINRKPTEVMSTTASAIRNVTP